jgi:hypothetical protein
MTAKATKKNSFEKDLEVVKQQEAEVDRLRLTARVDEKTRELSGAKTLIRSLQAEVDRLATVKDFLKTTDLNQVPKWAKPPNKNFKQEHGIVNLLLSDLHLDEVVRPEEMQGRNAYNREIAELRLKRVFDGVVEQATFYHTGTQYDGCNVLLGGDLVSGSIHEELRETNEYPVPATIKHWTPQIAAGLNLLADVFGQVHVASVVGNHGRFTQKPRYKLRAFDNADWLISALLAERFATDSRFTFDVPEGTDTYVTAYDTRYLLTHGDQASGGGGIGGIWPPIMRLKARKQANNTFDHMCIGHWHQIVHSQGITVNGSLKGWDEFAMGHNFQAEEAKQAMWITTPERGTTWPVEIFAQDRKAEGW